MLKDRFVPLAGAICGFLALSAARRELPLRAQLAGFLLLSAGRQWLFTTFFTFLLQRFGTGAYGRLVGAAGLISGGLCLGMNPLLRLALDQYEGSFVGVQLVQLGCCAVLGHFVVYLRRDLRGVQEEKEKHEEHRVAP